MRCHGKFLLVPLHMEWSKLSLQSRSQRHAWSWFLKLATPLQISHETTSRSLTLLNARGNMRTVLVLHRKLGELQQAYQRANAPAISRQCSQSQPWQTKRPRKKDVGNSSWLYFRCSELAGKNMAEVNLPWVEKYRPSSLDQLISHQDIISTSKTLPSCLSLPLCSPRVSSLIQFSASSLKIGYHICFFMGTRTLFSAQDIIRH
jgi:hypothetical protein